MRVQVPAVVTTKSAIIRDETQCSLVGIYESKQKSNYKQKAESVTPPTSFSYEILCSPRAVYEI
jgi:hypothetical protein